MSDLTRCNYCKLKDMKKRHDEIILVEDGGWIALYSHGERVGLMWEISSECVC